MVSKAGRRKAVERPPAEEVLGTELNSFQLDMNMINETAADAKSHFARVRAHKADCKDCVLQKS